MSPDRRRGPTHSYRYMGWEISKVKNFLVIIIHGEIIHLDNSLKKAGFHRDDITDVFMTHLHFDHCGGSVQWNKDQNRIRTRF